MARRSFGAIKTQRSGRLQASYVYLDTRHHAPETFTTRGDAEAWLNEERRLIEWDRWEPPAARLAARRARDALTVRSYSETWLRERTAAKRLAPRTISEYERYLDRAILPELGDMRLPDVTPATIKRWLAGLNPATPGYNANVYNLLKSMFRTAAEDELITKNPCRENLRKPKRKTFEPATPEQLDTIVANVPERLRLMIKLAAWCALRFGEVAELRRGDVALMLNDEGEVIAGKVKIRRAVQWDRSSRTPEGEQARKIVKTPKADSQGDVAIPPHLWPEVAQHLATHVEAGYDALLFPTRNGTQYRPDSFYGSHWDKARRAAERPDLRFHDLRHTGNQLAAEAGASLADQMRRLRHSSVAAALAYQHAASGSDERIAAALSMVARAHSESGG